MKVYVVIRERWNGHTYVYNPGEDVWVFSTKEKAENFAERFKSKDTFVDCFYGVSKIELDKE